LKSVETGLKIVRRIHVRCPLIAPGIKITGGFIAQQDFHKLKKGCCPTHWAAAPTITKSGP